jgi:hypothetical protein
LRTRVVLAVDGSALCLWGGVQLEVLEVQVLVSGVYPVCGYCLSRDAALRLMLMQVMWNLDPNGDPLSPLERFADALHQELTLDDAEDCTGTG